jgi:tripeptidyl-peptidase-1
MRYYLFKFSVLSLFAAGFLAVLTTPVTPSWDIMHVKHAWNSVPINWESLGPPPIGTTINLHIFLKPHHENALLDALYEVSTPKHPKCDLFTTRCMHLLICATAPIPDMVHT